MNPRDLKAIVSSGLLSFPVTDFDEQGDFRPETYIQRHKWLAPYGATALFAAGGTGEFFSLTGGEYPLIIKTAVNTCAGKVPIIAGVCDIETMSSIYMKMGNRFSYLGGLPTAEVYAAAYKALGTTVYSSAVFNFIPKTAMDFYHAVAGGDLQTQHRLLKDFFMPYLAICNKMAGYAVSIVKAGAKIVGHDAGPVRPPLTDLQPNEMEELRRSLKLLARNKPPGLLS